MSEEAVTTSWFSRLGSAFKGVVIGFIMVLAAVILLFWNEGRSVRRYKEISFAKDNVQEANINAVDASLEGKLVHFAGAAATPDVLRDENFGVEASNSFSMRSTVEMYQWKEVEHRETGKTKKNVGGSTTKEPDKVWYTYEKAWCSSIQNSDSFKEKVDKQTNEERKNPTVMPYAPKSYSATNVTVGAYTLPANKASSLGSSQKYPVDYEKVKDNLPKTAIVADDGAIYFNVYGEENYNKAMGINPVVNTPAEAAPAHHQPAPETAAQTTVQNVQTAVENTVANTQTAAQTAVNNTVANTQAAAQTAVNNTVANTQAAPQAVVENTAANTQAAPQAAVENTAANTQAAPQTTVDASAVNVVAYQANKSNPKIGDVRISYENSPVCDVTVIAKQTGNTVETYKIDEDLSYIDIRNGNLEAKAVFADNEKSEGIMVWILRLIGFFIMAAGFNAIFKPLSVMADVLPFLGNIAEAGCGIISKLLAFGLSMLVIAIAWLYYRPLLAICLFILMGAAIFGIVTLLMKAKASKKAAPAAPAAEPAPETPAAN